MTLSLMILVKCSDKVMLGLMSPSEHQAIFTWALTLSALAEKYDFIDQSGK